MQNLFNHPLTVLNAGLESFAKNVNQAGANAIHMSWQPPVQGNEQLGWSLAKVINHPKIEAANQKALQLYQSSMPVLVGVMIAKDAIAALNGQKRILHAGPPIEWDNMCGPVKGAILGAILYEQWAKDLNEAEQLILSKEVQFEPCHHYNAVGPMAGIISPSMPLWVVEDHYHKDNPPVYCNFNEGLGKVLRFGANNHEVLTRLNWMGSTLKNVISAALKQSGGIDLKPIMGQALHMGDEVHNRNIAATGLLLKQLLPAMLDSNMPIDEINASVKFIMQNDHFFLNLSMAASKCMLNAAKSIPHSTMVTVMARNGVNFGIQLSGTGNTWFQAKANPVNGLFFPGYGIEDAAADLGDSAITETAGVGGFAMASSPAIVKFVGGTPIDATNNSRLMQAITIGNNPAFTLPALNFTPTAAGIDIRKVLDTGILPIINTGIAHKEAGIGQIGAGITTAPMACFVQALETFCNEYSDLLER